MAQLTAKIAISSVMIQQSCLILIYELKALVEQHYHFSVVATKLMSTPVTTPDGIVAPPQRVHHSSAESLPAFGEDFLKRNFTLCKLEGLIRSDDALPMFFICPHLKRVICWNFYEGDHRDYSLRLFQAVKIAERDKGCRIQYFYGKSDQPMKSLATVPSWHMNPPLRRRLGEIMDHSLSFRGTSCHGLEHLWNECPNIYAVCCFDLYDDVAETYSAGCRYTQPLPPTVSLHHRRLQRVSDPLEVHERIEFLVRSTVGGEFRSGTTLPFRKLLRDLQVSSEDRQCGQICISICQGNQ